MEQNQRTGQRSNPYAWNPIYWMAYGLCSLPVVLMRLVSYVVGHIGIFIFHHLKAKATENALARHEVNTQATAAQETEAPNVATVKPVVDPTTDLWEEPPWIMSEIGRVELSNGYVVFRYHASRNLVTGKLTLTETAKSKRRKKPITALLEAACSSRSDASRIMKNKGEEALASLLVPSKGKTKVRPPEKSAAVPADGFEDIPPDWEMPAYLRSDGAHDPDPFEHFATAPLEAKAPQPPKFAAKAATPEVTYKGVLLAFGKENRKLDDPQKGERNVQHYGVRIFDEHLQAEQPLWGNDLRRVIQEADAKVGDRIELGLIGETEVLIKGRPTKKKVWSLTKL